MLPLATSPEALKDRQLHLPMLLQLALGKVQQNRIGSDELPAIVAGIQRYGDATFTAPPPQGEIMWQQGDATLQKHGEPSSLPPLLLIPSLINSPRIFHLTRERSFIDWLLAHQQREIYLIDWGDLTIGNTIESQHDLVQQILLPVMAQIGRCDVLGYCLGGVFAIRLAAAAADLVRSLTLLAAPYDSWRKEDAIAPSIRSWLQLLSPVMEVQDAIPSSWLYTFFATLPHADTPEKFARLISYADDNPSFLHFLAVEDWTQRAPPVPAKLLREILSDIYLSRAWIDAAAFGAIACPVHVVGPQRDLIVPPCCALSVLDRLPQATLFRPDCGHVGAMAGRAGPREVWPGMLEWWRGL